MFIWVKIRYRFMKILDSEFLEKNNMTNTDSLVLHYDKTLDVTFE